MQAILTRLAIEKPNLFFPVSQPCGLLLFRLMQLQIRMRMRFNIIPIKSVSLYQFVECQKQS